VRPLKNVLVVNLGDMLSRITNYTLKATYHRVLDIGVERFSSPFFLEPHFSAGIPALLSAGNEPEQDEKFIYGEWLIEKMRTFGEYKNFEAKKK